MSYKVLKRENKQGIRIKYQRKFTLPLGSLHVYYLMERNVSQWEWKTFQKEEYSHNY